MKLTRKQEFLEKLEGEIKKAQGLLEKKEEAKKLFRSASRSQQGDRLYHEDAFHMANQHLNKLLSLKKLVTSTSDQIATSVESVSFVEIEFQDGTNRNFYYAREGLTLLNLPVVTPESPLGKAIGGKKTGDCFSYQVEREGGIVTFSGKIKKVE